MLIFFINFFIEREIHQKRDIFEYISYNDNMCNNEHKLGYSPNVNHGTYRYCWKKEPVTFQHFTQIKQNKHIKSNKHIKLID